jgi:hypothetical protein
MAADRFSRAGNPLWSEQRATRGPDRDGSVSFIVSFMNTKFATSGLVVDVQHACVANNAFNRER